MVQSLVTLHQDKVYGDINNGSNKKAERLICSNMSILNLQQKQKHWLKNNK